MEYDGAYASTNSRAPCIRLIMQVWMGALNTTL
eukprot:CAMPEP_0196774436 /NCGR_PEP_ID=MMETSP1104-20130614/3408_1 /TAXON_ID=33652 /ORGANISM="Cafeteria sp., Strain Caron Lab Isolate" /LENGTH=32 /DNA_ID= /DNA_START= /DNA_END= /DNA_ORIENTATION=